MANSDDSKEGMANPLILPAGQMPPELQKFADRESIEARILQKRKEVIFWLAIFKFSSHNILANLVGCTPGNLYATLNYLLNTKIIHDCTVDGYRLFGLTVSGVEEYRGLIFSEPGKDTGQEISTRPVRWDQLQDQWRHTLLTQMACLQMRKQGFTEFTTATWLRKRGLKKIPDALAYRPGYDIPAAIELERFMKDARRMKKIVKAYEEVLFEDGDWLGMITFPSVHYFSPYCGAIERIVKKHCDPDYHHLFHFHHIAKDPV